MRLFNKNNRVGAWRSLVAHLHGVQGVPSSNLGAPTNLLGSIPETWVTFYSGDIGNTFTSKGFGAHSTRMLSSSKNPRSYCIKLTSQTCSATCLIPTFCPVKTPLRLILRPVKQMRRQLVTVMVRSWKGYSSSSAKPR